MVRPLTCSAQDYRAMECGVCGQPFDMRDLAQVLFHETHRPVAAPTWSSTRDVTSPDAKQPASRPGPARLAARFYVGGAL